MDEEARPDEEFAAVAVWFNKREVARIDVAAEHTLGPENDGWRIDFHDGGSMRVTMAKGPKESFGVVAGDSLLSSDEDFYLALHARDEARRERKERSEAKRSTREARKAGGGDNTGPAKRSTSKGGR